MTLNNLNGQFVLTVTCVLVAVAVLIRRIAQTIRNPGGSGCHSGGCSGCPSKNATGMDGFISLDQLTKKDLQ